MNDLIITVCYETRKVKLNRGFIGLNGEKLQGNIVVDFKDSATFVDGTATFEVEQKGTKHLLQMQKDADNKVYTLPIKSSLLRYACTLKCQVSITQAETDDGIPVYKTEIFQVPCYEAINATETIPEQYPSWLESANAKLAEIDTATERANAISADLEEKVASDYYRGEKGEKGEKGDSGGAVNNATLTIQKNGAKVATFTANASKNATANIIVPTKTSDLTNDSDFATNSSVDAKIAKIPSSGGGGASIIDVEILPTENINRNAFYRVREKIAILNGVSNFFGTTVVVKKVETLPAVGESSYEIVVVYYQTNDNEVYVYFNSVWVTLSVLCEQTGLSYGGVVSSREEATESNTVYVTNGDYEIYSYTDKWEKVNENKNGVKVKSDSGFDRLFYWFNENGRSKNILKVAVGHFDTSGIFCTHELLQNPTFAYENSSEHELELRSVTFNIFDSGWLRDENSHIYKQITEVSFRRVYKGTAEFFERRYTNLRYQSDGSNITIKEDTNPAYTPYSAEETFFITYTDNDEVIKIQ